MEALIDPHAFIWWMLNDPQLSIVAKDFIENPDNSIYLSTASVWEIAIKAKSGKYSDIDNVLGKLQTELGLLGMKSMAIEMKHALKTYELPERHKDPFDRILIAQSLVEKMPLITSDSLIAQYEVETIW